MIHRKETIAMLLAGGQGSRLYALTSNIAKPAVTFGGKYRIIDFPLSNCINSGIDTVGVLTQYQPLVLNEYIGNGQPWDLDRTYGGVHVLPPYQAKKKSEWYKGTANAIYQNLHFINRYDPENVVILSGDHIYKMDYAAMVDFHNEHNADCTIAVIQVPMKEASRFGIMTADENGKIVEFEEKPKAPKSDLASMGIYVFRKDVLERYLIEDEADPKSSNDFGKNIIPNMLRDGKCMMAYRFEGYWKDVGTIDSLWHANMDLIGENPAMDLFDPPWPIHSRNPIEPPQFIAEEASVENSMLGGGCRVYGTVVNSLLSSGVTIGRGAVIRDSVIFANTVIGDGCVVDHSIIDENVVIEKDCKIGLPLKDKSKIAVIGRDCVVKEGSILLDDTMMEVDD